MTALPVVILAGGLAKRVRPLSTDTPKALLKINGIPFVDYQMRFLCMQGIREVVMCIGFLGEKIEAFLGDGRQYGLKIKYSYDGNTLRGTGGAIKNAAHLLHERFFILYGDSFLPINYSDVQRAYQESYKASLMTVYRNDNKWDKSNVIFCANTETSKLGTVESYDKKNFNEDMQYIDYGLSCCNLSEILCVEQDTFDIADVFNRLAKQGNLAGYEASCRFYEIGSFNGISDFEQYITRNNITV